MNLGYRIHYAARKAVLSLWGPAQLDPENDPRIQLEKEREARLGPRKAKERHDYVPRRHFSGPNAAK